MKERFEVVNNYSWKILLENLWK